MAASFRVWGQQLISLHTGWRGAVLMDGCYVLCRHLLPLAQCLSACPRHHALIISNKHLPESRQSTVGSSNKYCMLASAPVQAELCCPRTGLCTDCRRGYPQHSSTQQPHRLHARLQAHKARLHPPHALQGGGHHPPRQRVKRRVRRCLQIRCLLRQVPAHLSVHRSEGLLRA